MGCRVADCPPLEMTLQRRISAGLFGPALTCFAIAFGLATGLKIDQPFLAPAPSALAGAAFQVIPSLYDKNGVDWTDGMCFSRERQSPVNFDDHIKDPPRDVLKYHYEPISNVKLQMQASHGLVFIDTSHLQIGEVAFNGDLYPLVRIDFHANSEHLFKGKRHAMEIQLIHRKIDDPLKSLVIAVPVWSETTPLPPTGDLITYLKQPLGVYFPPAWTEPDHNTVLQSFLTVRPPTAEGQIADVVIPPQKPLNLAYFVQNPALPDSGEYIQYSGSLTSPPCQDTTTWFVRRKPMIASDAQTKAFADSIFRLTNRHGNFRAVMPVNQRHLQVFRAQWVMSLPVGVKRLPLGPNARTDKEYQAEKLADMAKDLSQDAVDYMADFGKRLRRSARGLQHNLDKGKVLMTTPAPQNNTSADDWENAVQKMRTSMHGIVNGIKGSVDKNMRRQTVKTHKKAAREGERARMMTAAWELK